MATATNVQMGGAFDPTRDVVLNQTLTVASTTAGPWTPSQVTATGATGTTAAALPLLTPCVVAATGASGAGVALLTGACVPGAFYVIKNMMTGALNLYSVGATINGTTGTTAYAVTATGNLACVAFCVNAGAWQIVFNT